MRKLVEVFAQLEIAPGKLVSQKAYGPVADELKMGVELDRILTMGVMAELDTRRSAHVDIEVFIPLSSDSVVSPAYLNWLESSLIFTPLDKKHNLVLVVGREALLNGGKLLRDFLDKTHLLGCKAALASYGRDADDGKRIDSGASISPTFFDYVLLDEKLIADFESGAVAPMVVFSAVEAAKRLRAKVIACGVKEPKTIAQLWRLGVRDYQGYLVEAPKTTMDLSAAIPQIFV
jgi:EAL domain-containing protein (putative c-di-GMP-specific phosphodiesterase class I)